MTGLYADRIPDEVKAIAAFHRSLTARLRPDPIPLVTEQIAPIGQSYEARKAREHLASLSPERRAELEKEWER
ncbi:hypothetical protein [Novosphingobium sp. JCM 18896]|uniref:hypothetical protein n=1 Tax=Novosphingobium sp. JCM 18896 TaxID=2989731 RepID=UPI00222277FA|nr:hypothetical protein [Novosphingobium sp. JCM 18896]MCW1431370.1 hypothetical protein [Novosphingobium sp. JCM 18896]